MSPSTLLDADVCIVGAGIAGLYAACCLPPGRDVLVVEKGAVGEGSSPLAQGGLAAAIGSDDSPERHLADTIAAGVGLVDRRAAEVLCAEAPERVRDLLDLGCAFDREAGDLHLAREGGQSVARSVHRADATGAEIVRALREAARPLVRRHEAYAYALAVAAGAVCGVWAVEPDGTTALVRAPAVLLASGGAGALFASTTNPPAATGDAIALAAAAGARVADLEFVQFHPTALAVAESPRPLLTEALRGAGAYLVDRDGRRFMPERHPDAELAPRHVVTKAILDVGEAYLDATHLGVEELERHFPTAVESCRVRGFDLAAEPVPVAPAAHYLIGGVATDLAGRASLPGLFAAGECAATEVHGANRMAGNSLSEAVVFGRRAALAISAMPGERLDAAWNGPPAVADPTPSPEVRARVFEEVTRGAGPIRDGRSADSALQALLALEQEMPAGDVRSLAMARTGRLLVAAALARRETRGVHVRADWPEVDPALDGVHLSLAP